MKLLLNTGNISGITLYIQCLKTVIFLQLKMTWNNLGHFYIRLIKLILKQHNCLTGKVLTLRYEITPPSTQAELSPSFSPVMIICSLSRWLLATKYLPRLTSASTNCLWGLTCYEGEREDKSKTFMLA